ncbi:hypothetical protein [Streptomyces sp. NPDC006285]|uniref:hypothetical protein n=1 Tax=Streptomyces sp. NPDC006285 TaxID=3364742 RepID=UPI00369DA45A
MHADAEGRHDDPSDAAPDEPAADSADPSPGDGAPAEPTALREEESDAVAVAETESDAVADAESDADAVASGDTSGDRSVTPVASAPGGERGAGGEGGPDLFGSDELALRRLLQQAVVEIEPADGALDHLRRAVPARRARKRQAVVGMAAAALFIGTAVPALVHVSNSTGSDADPSLTGNASATHGGANEGKEASAGSGSGKAKDSSKESDKGDKKDKTDKGKGSEGSTAGAAPTVSSAGAPPCAPTQLTAGGGGVSAPDAIGAVYGTFTITNVSAASCTVVGGGSVSPTALGAADQSKINTALHGAGDAASALPDPSTYLSSAVLQPGGAYNVQFAWVPSETCPTSGGTGGGGEPSPDPTPSENPSGGTGGTVSEGTGGVDAQLMKSDGAVEGSVSVAYVAEGGAPSISAVVPNACAGTVYRTGVLAGL